MKHQRSASQNGTIDHHASKRVKMDLSMAQNGDLLKPTPSKISNGKNIEELMKRNLIHYGLDYVEDPLQHSKNIFDKNSKWYSRTVKPLFSVEKALPYKTETHLDQARYLCHVLVNLYISINSLDIQGLISISSKDLKELKDEIGSLLPEKSFLLFSQNVDTVNNDIADYDEGEEDADDDDDEDDMFGINEYIDSSGPDFNATGKITTQSSTVINVNHWTNELKNCLHFDFPITLRKALTNVFYYLSLIQGQKIYRQLHVEIFSALVNIDDDGTNFTEELIEQGLKLDHQILMDFLGAFLPYPDSDFVRYEISSKEDLQLFRVLLKLAHNAKPFFDKKDSSVMKNLMNSLLSSLSPSTMTIVLPMITSIVPYHYHQDAKVIDYFPFFYSFWSSVSANIAIDTHIYDFVGNIAEDVHWKSLNSDTFLQKSGLTLGKFNLFTDSQMIFMFNRLQGHLRTDGQIHSYSRTVRPFVFGLNGSQCESYFDKLLALTRSIETFVHPSNTGFWTKPIAKFIHSFTKMYHKRAKKEEKLKIKNDSCLTQECHTRIVEMLFDLLTIGAQNKHSEVANYYISALAYLLDLKPKNSELIFERTLIDLYESLAGDFINSRHRLISALKRFTRTIRYMVMEKVYRVHIINLLSMLVAKIDINDINLTSNVFNCIVSIASFTPLIKMVKDDEFITFESTTLPFITHHFEHMKALETSEKFEYDPEVLDKAIRAANSSLENILLLYINKLFQLVDIDLDDGLVTKINQTTMLMIESMDDHTFNIFSKLLQKKFWDNDSFSEKEPNYEVITVPLSSLVKRDPFLSEKLFDQLSFNVYQQIERGAGSVRNSTEIQHRDVKLVLYLTALNDVFRQSHSALLKYSDKLLSFLHDLYEKITNPPIDVVSSILIHSVLSTLTNTEISTCRMFPEDCPLPLDERWGGMQFDKRKFIDGYLEFDWHKPNEEEITLAINIFASLTDYCINSVETLLQKEGGATSFADEIQKFVLVVTHALSGSSLLFDPDYNSIVKKYSNFSKSGKKLLYLQQFNTFSKSATPDPNVDFRTSSKMEEELEYIESTDTDAESNIAEQKDVDDLIMEDTDISRGPSGFNTPAIGSHSESLASRPSSDLDIYTCNYFFGVSQDEKALNPYYFEVHKLRAKVGLFFHKMFQYSSSNFENNNSIYRILLHGLKVWFTDIGQETIFNNDSSCFLDLEFLENIQALSGLQEPYTTTCLAIRANTFHQSRVLLKSTTRRPSNLETLLLKDVIELASSVYPDVHKPAQGTLVHCMKQLMGSYSIIINSLLPSLETKLVKEDYMGVQVILKILMIKKIHRKLHTDYRNFKKLLKLLFLSANISEQDISLYSEKLLNEVVSGIKIPSSICVMSDKIFSPIFVPQDESITSQVDVIRRAKEKKRDKILNLLSSLQENMIERLCADDELGWKMAIIMMRYVTRIQSSLEIKTDRKAITAIYKQSSKKHPILIHMAVKAFLGIFNKLYALNDYDNDITNSSINTFDPNYVESIDTSNSNYNEIFKAEMKNFESPNYFLDNRAFRGWLCWGNKLKVLKTDPIPLDMTPENLLVMEELGKLVSKDWLLGITTTLLQDNETKSVFSSGNVSFFILVISLISKSLCDVSLSFLFELCEKYYDRYDKASMITSVEILSALIVGSKFMTAEMNEERNQFVDRFLPDCLNHELNNDAFEIWSTVAWWLPTVVDIRRCPPLYKHFRQLNTSLDTNSDAAAHHANRILMFRGVLTTLEYKTPQVENIVEELVFNHPYDQVREAIAKLFVTVIQNSSQQSASTPDELIKATHVNPNGLGMPMKSTPEYIQDIVKSQFVEIVKESTTLEGLTPQEILRTKFFYLASTLYYWIKEMSKGPNRVLLIQYLTEYVAPFLMELMKHKDVCKLANIDPTPLYASLAYMPYRKEHINDMISLICDKEIMKTSYQIRVQLSFVQHFFSSQLLQLSDKNRKDILEFVVDNLYDENHLEVRMKAADVLSDIIHNLGQAKILYELIEKFDEIVDQKNYTWKERKELSKSNIKIHGSVVGLGAIISAFPYDFPLPKWIPKQLSILSSWARTNGISGSSAKTTISEFKKVRIDTWQFDRAVFSTDELEDLEGVLWRSYYA